jgi:hypothetical protein
MGASKVRTPLNCLQREDWHNTLADVLQLQAIFQFGVSFFLSRLVDPE